MILRGEITTVVREESIPGFRFLLLIRWEGALHQMADRVL